MQVMDGRPQRLFSRFGLVKFWKALNRSWCIVIAQPLILLLDLEDKNVLEF